MAQPAQILALSHFSSDPASASMDVATARRFPATAGTAEELLSLAPDVVIGDAFVPPATRAALAERGIRLVQLPIVDSVVTAREQVMQIARLAGHEGAGRALDAQIDAALAQAAPPPGSRPVSAIVWQAGGIVPGRDTLIADLLRRTGFTLQTAARGMGQADYLPLEQVFADPPRVLLVAGKAGPQENRLLGHPALAALTHTTRAALDPSLLWCGGPTVVRAVRRLAEVREGVAKAAISFGEGSAPPPTPSSEEEGATGSRNSLPLLFRGGGRGVVENSQRVASR